MKILYALLLFTSIGFAQVELQQPTPLDVCDDNNDGFSVFDLTVKTPEILGSLNPNDYIVTFHETLTDAQNGTSQIAEPMTYFNLVNPQTLYVRATEVLNTLNYGVAELTIRVLPGPTVPELPALSLCDDDNDGSQEFDLSFITEIVLLSSPDYTVTFHESEADAVSDQNPLGQTYLATMSATTIFVRVETTQMCSLIYPLDLFINPNPVVDQPQDYVIVENPTDGFAEFDLNSQIPGITGGMTDVNVTFHLTAGDAQSNSNPLPSPFTNTSNPQQVWISIQNSSTGCVYVTSFLLRVVDELGVDDLTANEISIGPNPSSGIISLTANSIVYDVDIYDLTGRLMQRPMLDDSLMIDLSGYASGQYLLRIRTENGISVKKIILR